MEAEMAEASARVGRIIDRLTGRLDGANPFMARIGAHLENAGHPNDPLSRIGCLLGVVFLGRDALGGSLSTALSILTVPAVIAWIVPS